MNTDSAIESDLADIEAIRAKIAAEVEREPNSSPVQAGVEAYAKARIEDLTGLLADYRESAAYVSIQDMLSARIKAIRNAYRITP